MISSTQVNKFQTTPYHFINNFFSSNRFLPPNRNCFGFNAVYDGHSTSRNVHIQPIKINYSLHFYDIYSNCVLLP